MCIDADFQAKISSITSRDVKRDRRDGPVRAIVQGRDRLYFFTSRAGW